MLEATIENGKLVLPISTKPDNIWHVWNTTRGSVPADCNYLVARAKIKISGSAFVAMGIDFWRPDGNIGGVDINNTEAGATNWYYNTTDWTEVELVLQ